MKFRDETTTAMNSTIDSGRTVSIMNIRLFEVGNAVDRPAQVFPGLHQDNIFLLGFKIFESDHGFANLTVLTFNTHCCEEFPGFDVYRLYPGPLTVPAQTLAKVAQTPLRQHDAAPRSHSSVHPLPTGPAAARLTTAEFHCLFSEFQVQFHTIQLMQS